MMKMSDYERMLMNQEADRHEEPEPVERIYIFGKEATADSFRMTAHHFGHEVKRHGSALIMPEEVYREVQAKIVPYPAVIVAVQDELAMVGCELEWTDNRARLVRQNEARLLDEV